MLNNNIENSTSKKPASYRGVEINGIPAINVLSHEVFTERAEKVFEILDQILGRSCGPYGAQTIISDFPSIKATKDGYRIAMNLQFDPAGTEVDKLVYKMAMDICGRINYAVGDGTTTAIMATYQMFVTIAELMRDSRFSHISAKEFIDKLSEVKDMILESLSSKVKMVNIDDIGDVMRKIAYVSTNGDVELSNMVADAYEKFKYPVVRAESYDGPRTYLDTPNGFPCKVRLGDNVYINKGNGRGIYEKVYALIFDYQLSERDFTKIIAPVLTITRNLGFPLMIIAPSFDEALLYGRLRKIVLDEYRDKQTISLIISPYPANTKADKQEIRDLALILGTSVIDKTIRSEIYEYSDNHPGVLKNIYESINIFGRDIPETKKQVDIVSANIMRNIESKDNKEDIGLPFIDIGYASLVDIGDNESIFKPKYYNEELHQKAVESAKSDLANAIKKYTSLGNLSSEVYDAQRRYVSLMMKTAVIYVGGDTAISQGMRSDSADDAIRAAESAFFNGYCLGANIDLIRSTVDVINNLPEDDILRIKIAEGFKNAFIRVSKKIFENKKTYTDEDIDRLINSSLETRSVYDIRTDSYSEDVITSAKTDKEVLLATCDLLGILLSGNQVILSRYVHTKQ